MMSDRMARLVKLWDSGSARILCDTWREGFLIWPEYKYRYNFRDLYSKQSCCLYVDLRTPEQIINYELSKDRLLCSRTMCKEISKYLIAHPCIKLTPEVRARVSSWNFV